MVTIRKLEVEMEQINRLKIGDSFRPAKV